MRDIKFRVWDKELKLMHICGENIHDNIFFNKNNIAQYYNLQNGCGSPTTYELMQYTGLKDKNGKEIYEGDIVKYEKFYVYDFDYDEGIAIIYWDNEDTGFYGECQSYNYSLDMFYLIRNLSSEVIGNIFDNPELLEVGD